MLKNLDSLPLERIHNMLKMFASSDEHKCEYQIINCVAPKAVWSESLLHNHTDEKTSAELARFLAQLVEQDKLECVGGHYNLKKN